MFKPSVHSDYTLLRSNPSATDLIAQLSSYRVKNGSDMAAFLKVAEAAVEAERGGALDSATKSGLATLITQAKSGSVKQVAAIFGQVKSGAKDSGAPKTADAITAAAAWYYYNVEEPGAGKKGSTASTTAAVPASEETGDSPFYSQTWFLIAAPITVATILGAVIWFWPADTAVAPAK